MVKNDRKNVFLIERREPKKKKRTCCETQETRIIPSFKNSINAPTIHQVMFKVDSVQHAFFY